MAYIRSVARLDHPHTHGVHNTRERAKMTCHFTTPKCLLLPYLTQPYIYNLSIGPRGHSLFNGGLLTWGSWVLRHARGRRGLLLLPGVHLTTATGGAWGHLIHPGRGSLRLLTLRRRRRRSLQHGGRGKPSL